MWVEHFGVDAVAVLFDQPLARRAGTGHRRAIGLPVGTALDLEGTAGRDVLPVVDQRAALDDPPLAAGAQFDQPGGPVEVLVGNVPDPGVGRDLQVAIARDHLIAPSRLIRDAAAHALISIPK